MASQRIHRWRLLTWLALTFNLTMLLWLVVALDAAEGEANNPGSSTGTWLVAFVWLAGAVLLGAAWLVTHHTERPGRRARRGWHR
ncbi:hypothetical protein ACIHJG_20450 [Streptomyces sp. NPDC052415]|uniref:hypothetical protein n=1 Tax=Streptomyces sp. NPDC052415 TaxID=3365690 RepID=UPI0037CEF962